MTDITDKLREIYLEMENEAVVRFCDELIALDDRARIDSEPAIHATSTRLTGLLAVIRKRREI